MYLLDRDGDSRLRLTEFDQGSTPPYAILSHTWGLDEVLYSDVQKGLYDGKTGYGKIDFCLAQARRDGLQYCWIDTCCIDKANSTELSEAINSMFRWYSSADRCYVYLSDVPAVSLRSSRWFTRGWTLQELLAPGVVDFFSSTGEKLGDKTSLTQIIHGKTQVPIKALQGEPLHQFSVEKRMSWIAQRQTKREEDMAYSLLGIFDVSMPLIYGEGRKKAELRLRRLIQEMKETEGEQRPGRAATDQDFTLPFALPGAPIIASFVGRAEEMAQLSEALPFSGGRETAVLHGLGGMGKTQLAIEFASERRHDYTAVLWLDGRNEASLQQSFAGMAGRLSRAHPSLTALRLASESTNVTQAVGAVLEWLDDASNDGWLVVVDNVDAPHLPGVVEGLYEPQRYLPTTLHGHVLITTRSSQLRIGKQIKLQRIRNIKECVAILQASSQWPELEQVFELVKRLDGLPLALSAAGHYIGQTAVSPAEYLDLYEQSWLELQQNLPDMPEHQGRTLLTTWELSRQQVAAKSPGACRLLGLWAFFAGQDIWYELLAAGREDSPEWFSAITKSRISFDRHMRVLCDHGLVEVQRNPAGYGIHGCVHDWVREVIGNSGEGTTGNVEADGDLDEDADLALRCISLSVPYDIEAEYWVTQRRLLDHADNWLKRCGARRHESGQFQYLNHLGALYTDQCRLTEAEAILSRVLAGKEKALGRDHLSTLDSVWRLAVLYGDQGRLSEAEALYDRALLGREQALGPEHNATLHIVAQLGGIYRQQGRLMEAQMMVERAIAGFEKELGGEHITTLRYVHNLGNIYRQQERLVAAEAMFDRALAGQEKTLGPSHIITLNVVGKLASLYHDQGRLEEAETMFNKALAGYEKTIGLEHTLALAVASNLGLLYEDQGWFADAKAIFSRVLAGETKILGPDNPKTQQTFAKLRLLNAESDG